MGATYDTRSRRNEASATSCTGVRYPLRTNTPSTTLESWSDQDRARSAARAQKEEVKSASGATSRSGVSTRSEINLSSTTFEKWSNHREQGPQHTRKTKELS